MVLLLVLAGSVLACRKKQELPWEKKKIRYSLLGLAGLVLAPLLLTAYMGEMIVTRSQFALPVAGAFLGMYVTERLGTAETAVRVTGCCSSADCASAL